jgi:hypothetical protein
MSVATSVETCSFGGVRLGEIDDYGADFRFTGLDGWGATQSTLTVTQRPTSDGGFGSPAYEASRTFTVQGAITCPTRPELIAAFDRLQGAAGINTQPVTIVQGGAMRYVMAQRQGEITVSDQSGITLTFAIVFLAVDGRKLAVDVSASTRLPSAVGGWQFPFTFPLTIASIVNTGTVSLTNPGNAVGKVRLRIDGRVTGPVVTHVSSGLSLVFASSETVINGNWLDVDMERRSVLENGQSSRNVWVTSRGFSGFDPGPNTWAFTAVNYDPTALLTVVATPAWQ